MRAHFYLADILRRTNNIDAAIQQLEIAQRLDPNLVEAQQAYAWPAQINRQDSIRNP